MDVNVNYKAGFGAGYNQLRVGDVQAATKELWTALEINNKVSFTNYRDGVTEPKASQAAAVEAVFKKYGITDIWGK